MSVLVMAGVWAHSEAAGTDRLVLLALADNADDNGECWPSIATVAQKCRVSGRTVQRSIRSLEELGEVVVIVGGGKSSTPGGTRSNKYTITVHLSEAKGDRSSPHPRQSDTPWGDTGVRDGVTLLSPEPSLNHQTTNARAVASNTESFDLAWTDYPRKVGRKAAGRAFATRLKSSADIDDLLTATRHFARAMAGTDPKFIMHGSRFYGPDEPWVDYIDPPADEPTEPKWIEPDVPQWHREPAS